MGVLWVESGQKGDKSVYDTCLWTKGVTYINDVGCSLAKLGCYIGLLNYNVLRSGGHGLKDALNYPFACQQSRGMYTKPHTLLYRTDMIDILYSKSFGISYGREYKKSLVCALTLFLGGRSMEMWLITIDKLMKQ